MSFFSKIGLPPQTFCQIWLDKTVLVDYLDGFSIYEKCRPERQQLLALSAFILSSVEVAEGSKGKALVGQNRIFFAAFRMTSCVLR